MTSSESASIGASTTAGATAIAFRFSLIITPHSGVGGRAPKPRKPKVPMRIGAQPARTPNSTSSTPAAFGANSRQTIDQTDSPRARAMVTKSRVVRSMAMLALQTTASAAPGSAALMPRATRRVSPRTARKVGPTRVGWHPAFGRQLHPRRLHVPMRSPLS